MDEEYEDYEEIEDFEESIDFNLYQALDSEEAAKQGGLKTFTVKDGGSAIFSKRTSDYKISVERLLWADGWEDSTKKGPEKQAMTLVVLKMVFTCTDSNGRFQHVDATLEFEDKKTKSKAEPDIQAWAPFREMQRTNTSEVEIKQTDKAEGQIGGGGYGVTASGSLSREKEISWKQTQFDQGQAAPTISKITGRRNGVNWFVKQNELQNHGVSPELWTAVLISRSSGDPYLVKFQISVHAGMEEDIKNKIKKWFGLGPGQTKAFLVTPSEKPTVNYEGKDILKNIDLNNLGKLRAKDEMSKLTVIWGFDKEDSKKGGEAKTA